MKNSKNPAAVALGKLSRSRGVSAAARLAAQINGRLGGRPKKSVKLPLTLSENVTQTKTLGNVIVRENWR